MKRDGSVSGGSVYSLHSTATVTSTSSSSSGSVLVDGASRWTQLKNRLFTLYTFVASRPLHRRTTLTVALIEFLQVFSFAFSGPFNGLWPQADASFFAYLTYVRTFASGSVAYETQQAVLWLVVVYVVLVAALGSWATYRLHRGEEDWTRATSLLYYMIAFFDGVLFLPSLSYCLGLLSCDRSTNFLRHFGHEACASTVSTVYFAVAAAAALACIAIGFVGAALFFPCFPDEKEPLSLTTSRGRILLCIAKIALALLAELAVMIPGSVIPAVVYGLALLVFEAGPLAFSVYFLPYHRFAANHVMSALLSLCLGAGVLRFATAVGLQAEIGLYAFAGLILPLCLGVAGISVLRTRGLARFGRQQTPNSGRGDTPFEKEFEVEVATRQYYHRRDEHSIDAALTLYIRAAEKFATCGVRLAQVVYMCVHLDDYQLLAANIARAKRAQPMPDELYLLNRVDNRRRLLVRQIDGGQEEITQKLARAAKYQALCKTWIARFWQHLDRGDDLSTLPEIVSSIDVNERAAEDIYGKLLVHFPRSARVIRAYGIFLDEVKNEKELGQYALRAADDLEDDHAKHTRRAAKKARADRHGRAPSGRPHGARDAINGLPGSTSDKAAPKTKNIRFSQPEDDDANEQQPAAAAAARAENSGDVKQQRRSTTTAAAEHSDHDDFAAADWADAAGANERDSEDELEMDDMLNDQVRESKKKRDELLRQRKYRRRIEQSKSLALQKLGFSIKTTLLVLLVDILVIFISSTVIIKSFTASVAQLEHAGMMRTWVNQQPMLARQMHKAAFDNDTALYETTRTMMFVSTMNYQTELTELRAADNSASVVAMWQTPNLNETLWISTSATSGYKQVRANNLWDMSTAFIQQCNQLGRVSQESMVHAEFLPEFRYIFDNFQAIRAAYVAGLDTFADTTVGSSDVLLLTLEILLPVSVALLLVLAFAVFRPTRNQLQQERLDALKLFGAIPKAVVHQIHVEVQKFVKGDDDNGDAEGSWFNQQQDGVVSDIDEVESSMPVLRTLTFRYFGTLGVIFAVIVSMVSLGFVLPTIAIPPSFEIISSYSRLSGTTRVQLFANEMAFHDNISWPRGVPQIRSQLNDSITSLFLRNNDIKYGNAKSRLEGQVGKDAEAEEMLYRRPCHLVRLGDQCRGLDLLLSILLADGSAIVNSPPEFWTNSSYLDELNFLVGYDSAQLLPGAVWSEEDGGELSIFEVIAAQLSIAKAQFAISSIEVPLIVLFATSFPVLIVTFLSLRPLENRIREENARTLKMLLMMPTEAIDKVPAIREYLESGRQETATQMLKEELDETITRNNSILGSSVDAIIVINAAKKIELFNPAAQAMFGLLERETVGQNVNMLMPATTALKHDSYVDAVVQAGAFVLSKAKTREVVAMRKDGTSFPITLSLTIMNINGKILLSAFVRDISEMKENEAALLHEKEKSDRLLLSLLPKAIAEQLKEGGIDASAGGTKNMIAEGYKEVTVLFADIVGFTTMSAHITPAELVFTLNQLFSGWDDLCAKHKIEKIKTIGDCYMACSGCPDRSVDHAQRMLDFAIEMLDKLRDFNRTYNRDLRLRIGINVGPVVAGVLGTRKITFDLWGDAVNVASRMESTGVENRIQVSHSAFEALQHDYLFEERGKTEIKGKGLMLTYLYKDRKITKTASGTVMRRAALTPPPELVAARRMSQHAQQQPQQHAQEGRTHVSAVSVDDVAAAGHPSDERAGAAPPVPSGTDEEQSLRARPTVSTSADDVDQFIAAEFATESADTERK